MTMGAQKYLTNEEINIAAREWAKEHSSAPDKDCPEWIIIDFEAGAYFAREKLTGFINLTNKGVKKLKKNGRTEDKITE